MNLKKAHPIQMAKVWRNRRKKKRKERKWLKRKAKSNHKTERRLKRENSNLSLLKSCLQNQNPQLIRVL